MQRFTVQTVRVPRVALVRARSQIPVTTTKRSGVILEIFSIAFSKQHTHKPEGNSALGLSWVRKGLPYLRLQNNPRRGIRL